MSAALIALAVLYLAHSLALRREARRWRETRADIETAFDAAHVRMSGGITRGLR